MAAVRCERESSAGGGEPGPASRMLFGSVLFHMLRDQLHITAFQITPETMSTSTEAIELLSGDSTPACHFWGCSFFFFFFFKLFLKTKGCCPVLQTQWALQVIAYDKPLQFPQYTPFFSCQFLQLRMVFPIALSGAFANLFFLKGIRLQPQTLQTHIKMTILLCKVSSEINLGQCKTWFRYS